MSSVRFFFEGTIKIKSFKKTIAKDWIKKVLDSFQAKFEHINYIFCSDEYLHGLNLAYLNHDTLTDIVTFNNSSNPGIIEGDIFISIERVKENALLLNQDFTAELHRVMIHGILHLVGFKDKSKAEKLEMRAQEDIYLKLINVPRGTYQ